MRIPLLLSVLFLVSCGKNQQTLTYVENPYDNSKNEAIELIQEARIDALENKMRDLQLLANINKVAIDRLIDSTIASYDNIDSQLSDLENVVLTNEIKVVKICNSGEHFIKTSTDY
jgi:SMC interacting uncharacterized protein involved in chromosome segregation